MKNSLIIIVTLILSVYLLTGCGSVNAGVDVSAEDVWAAIEEVTPEDTMPVMMDIEASELKTYYGLSGNEVMEFVGKMPFMNVAVTEILVIRMQKNQTDAVYQALQGRQTVLLEKWSGFDETQYALVQNCRIVQNSDWLLFAVAENADEIVSAFNACIDAYKK